MSDTGRLRIGTRGSALALAQTHMIAERLGGGGGTDGEREIGVEIVTVTTSGDRDAHADDKARWVDTIEDALLAGEIDLAVHSAKDVPGKLADGLTLLGAPLRAGAEDVLCGVDGLDALSPGARVGTSSIRRAAQLRAVRANLDVVTMSGNVDTRLRTLAKGDFDAIVLARAGLQRLGCESEIGAVLDPERFVPAPGQGALALEGRADDARVHEAVAAITDDDAFACLRAERALAQALDATCHTPLGAYAAPAGCGCLLLRAWVGLPDGSAWIADELAETGTGWGDTRSARIPKSASAKGACHPASVGGVCDPDELGRRVAARMSAAGATDLLRRAEEMAVAGA